jgi:hypothetical protein
MNVTQVTCAGYSIVLYLKGEIAAGVPVFSFPPICQALFGW